MFHLFQKAVNCLVRAGSKNWHFNNCIDLPATVLKSLYFNLQVKRENTAMFVFGKQSFKKGHFISMSIINYCRKLCMI